MPSRETVCDFSRWGGKGIFEKYLILNGSRSNCYSSKSLISFEKLKREICRTWRDQDIGSNNGYFSKSIPLHNSSIETCRTLYTEFQQNPCWTSGDALITLHEMAHAYIYFQWLRCSDFSEKMILYKWPSKRINLSLIIKNTITSFMWIDPLCQIAGPLWIYIGTI